MTKIFLCLFSAVTLLSYAQKSFGSEIEIRENRHGEERIIDRRGQERIIDRRGPREIIIEPRYRGNPEHGSWHEIERENNPTIRMQIHSDPRRHWDVVRDPNIIRFNHYNWRPIGHWNNWYRGWGTYWRIRSWNEIRTVTCEAVNTTTGYLYPVTETRSGAWYWNDNLVNNVAARALDECVVNSGTPSTCALVQRECWNSIY